MKGSLAFHDGHYEAALDAFRKSLDYRIRAHGPACPVLGVVYAMRAQTYLQLRDIAHANADIDRALDLIGGAVGKNSPSYLRVQLLRAQSLRLAGDTREAELVERNSNTALTAWRQAACAGCSVTVQSLR